MATKPKLTPTQAKVVKAKIKSELHDIPQRVTSQEVWPNAKPETAAMMMSREIRKDNVQDAIQQALYNHGLTTDALAETVGDAMVATKLIQVGTEFIESDKPDHSIRLKAAGMAAQWMGISKGENGGDSLTFIKVINEDKGNYAL